MTDTTIWIVIVGMALTNVILRALPLAILSRMELPPIVERWLGFVPVSVMAAMVATSVLQPDGIWLPPLTNPYLLASVPTAVVYRSTRSFLGATAVGILSFLAFRYMLG
ncbi:MAG: AzlD domain-containing protein [Coriobacteriia bacterium]|nr:AzlD domain-containing protein [Coriobacteriia bacterium]